MNALITKLGSGENLKMLRTYHLNIKICIKTIEPMTSGQKVREGGSYYYIIVTSYQLTDSPLLERPACLIFLFYQACIGPFLSFSCSTSYDCRLVTQSGSSLSPTF